MRQQANTLKHKGMSYEGMEKGGGQLGTGASCLRDEKAQVIVCSFSWNRRIEPLDLA